MELGGKVTIDCEKTNHRAELEFKLKVRDFLTSFSMGLPLYTRQDLATHTPLFLPHKCMYPPRGVLPREET